MKIAIFYIIFYCFTVVLPAQIVCYVEESQLHDELQIAQS